MQAQIVQRARILLLKADGTPIDEIADKVGINRKSVMLYIKKTKKAERITRCVTFPDADEIQR